MQTHNLKRKTPNQKPKLVGRGGTRGKTAGRGTKGQNARAGHKKRPEIRDFIKRLPKLRGRGKNINTSIQHKPSAVNLSQISSSFKSGETITPAMILNKGLVRKVGGKLPTVKILGGGEITIKITIKDCLVSESAKTAIEKAGGSVVI